MDRNVDPLANPLPLLRRVHAYVAYRIGPGADADDVTGETFARAVRYRARYDPGKGDPLSWLIGIAGRCIADASLADHVSVDEETPAAQEDLEQRTVERLTVAAAVARLAPRDRELIALRYGADLTARQIGAELNLNSNAVNQALHRALSRLRTFLDANESAVTKRSTTRYSE